MLVFEERQFIREQDLEVLLVVKRSRTVLKRRMVVAYKVKRLAISARGRRSREQVRALIHQSRPREAELELHAVAEALLDFRDHGVEIGVHVVGSIVES